jgi:Zn ribbon nucleic-acid-binding protein
MSGCSFTETCPKCGAEMYSSSDWKPHNQVSGECIKCGYTYWTETGRMSLEEMNGLRADMEQKPVKRRKVWRCEA